MAKLTEFRSFSGNVLRLCDRCDALMVSGRMADQVFLKVYICESCYQRQRRAEDTHRYAGAPPAVAPGKHKHTRSHHKRMFPEMPADFKIPAGIGPRLQGLQNLKKAGKMEAYARVRQELIEGFMRMQAS